MIIGKTRGSQSFSSLGTYLCGGCLSNDYLGELEANKFVNIKKR
jgi:hypothetical protein